MNVGLPADHRLQDCLEGIHCGSYNNLRGRIFTFSRIITFSSTIITLSSTLIAFSGTLVTLSNIMITFCRFNNYCK